MSIAAEQILDDKDRITALDPDGMLDLVVARKQDVPDKPMRIQATEVSPLNRELFRAVGVYTGRRGS